MIKTVSCLAVVLYTSTLLAEESCLSKEITNKNINNITGVGITYEEAKFDLHKKLPQIGILQSTRLRSVKVSSLNSYGETNILSQDIKANFDHFVAHNCKIDGKFAISVAFPKDGVSYLPRQHHKEVFDEEQFPNKQATYAFAQKSCGNDQFTIIVSLNDEYEVLKSIKILPTTSKRGMHTTVACGPIEIKGTWFANAYLTKYHSVSSNKYNLIYLGAYRGEPDIRDYSEELNLEMIKNAIGMDK